MNITKPLHAAILVSDLAKSQHFYSHILQLTTVDRPLNFPGIWYQIGDWQIHLIKSEQVIGDRVNEAKWGRHRHLAFAVADLAIAKAQLTHHNYPFQMSASGRSALFIADPDGNIIELSQI
ncbi:MAG: VOC family protein [Arthrospira sp. SH-MAG29]|nr:VOC family protein [Arthrospira sp. SH-MAG29]MBS0017607.1 VOC family protein [Arthrospira sp. SH-MAG29]